MGTVEAPRSWELVAAGVALATLAGCPAPGSISGRAIIMDVPSSAGITIEALFGGGPVAGQTTASTDGTWFIGGLPHGVYVVNASAPSTVEGGAGVNVTVQGPASVPDLFFTPAGRVRAVMRPPPGCTLGSPALFQGILPELDADGGATITLPAGVHDLRLFATVGEGESPAALVTGVEVEYDRTTELGEVQLGFQEPLGTIEGQVALACPQPWPGFHSQVTFSRGGTSGAGACQYGAAANPDGTFRIDGVSSGSYQGSAAQPPESLHTGRGSRPTIATVSDGGVADAGALPIPAYLGFGIVEGVVRYSDGGFASGVSVGVNSALAAVTATTDGGYYRLRPLCGTTEICPYPYNPSPACTSATVLYNQTVLAPDLILPPE